MSYRFSGVLREPCFRICAKQAECLPFTKFIPKLLQTHGCAYLALRPQNCHHLPERTHFTAITFGLENYFVDNLVEKIFFRPVMYHKPTQCALRIQRDITMPGNQVGDRKTHGRETFAQSIE